jgi:hypothetical protein
MVVVLEVLEADNVIASPSIKVKTNDSEWT